MSDFDAWVRKNWGILFRFWVYKKGFTPYEQEQKFIDESMYEDEQCDIGYIVEAIQLPDGDILLGFLLPGNEDRYIEYYKLSEIHLAYSESDNEDTE